MISRYLDDNVKFEFCYLNTNGFEKDFKRLR